MTTSLRSLFDNSQVVDVGKPSAQKAARFGPRGCDYCPLRKKKLKVINIDRVTGKAIFVVGYYPGAEESEQGLEFVGPAGRLLWKELASVGIKRADCDIQNVVRCHTTNDRGYNRDPEKKELHCCSIYTDEALRRSRARVYLVLGKVAGRQLLGREYRKDTSVFFSERLQAHVVATYHPSFFLRGAPSWRLRDWRRNLGAVATLAQSTGRFGILKRGDYKELKTVEALEKFIAALCKFKGRVSVDIEGNVQELWCVGWCWKPGSVRVFFLDHSQVKRVGAERTRALAAMARYFSDPRCKKIFHYGSLTDIDVLEAHMNGVKE